jgi:hypothetical protein
MYHSPLNQQSRRWSTPTSDEEAAKRSGGRRGYNAQRQFQRELDVSRATICRDVQALRAWWLRGGGVLWPGDLEYPSHRQIVRTIAEALGDNVPPGRTHPSYAVRAR